MTLYIDTTGTAAGSSMLPNTRYDYRIMATVSGGTASGWAFANATSHTDVPVRPVLTAAPDGEDAVDLSWNAPNDNGSEIQTYTVEYWDRASGTWKHLATNVAQTRTAKHSKPSTASTVYVYRLSATNRVGTSPWSTWRSVRTDAASE